MFPETLIIMMVEVEGKNLLALRQCGGIAKFLILDTDKIQASGMKFIFILAAVFVSSALTTAAKIGSEPTRDMHMGRLFADLGESSPGPGFEDGFEGLRLFGPREAPSDSASGYDRQLGARDLFVTGGCPSVGDSCSTLSSLASACQGAGTGATYTPAYCNYSSIVFSPSFGKAARTSTFAYYLHDVHLSNSAPLLTCVAAINGTCDTITSLASVS